MEPQQDMLFGFPLGTWTFPAGKYQLYKDMSWTLITLLELRTILRKMERKKTTGFDEMPITVIQDNVDILAEQLSMFYNKCYIQGVFSEQLKIAKIVPIYTKGEHIRPITNYRPMCLLPVLAKMREIV